MLVPVQCEYYALEGLSDLLSTIRIVKRSLNPEIALEGVVLTMYDGRTNPVSYTHLAPCAAPPPGRRWP